MGGIRFLVIEAPAVASEMAALGFYVPGQKLEIGLICMISQKPVVVNRNCMGLCIMFHRLYLVVIGSEFSVESFLHDIDKYIFFFS